MCVRGTEKSKHLVREETKVKSHSGLVRRSQYIYILNFDERSVLWNIRLYITWNFEGHLVTC